MSQTAHDFFFRGLKGGTIDLKNFAGHPILVVNTASRCGLTPQYKGLQELWRRYRPRGLVILGVPSNDFGAQEPGSETEISAFCESNYGVDFPMTSKEPVIGPQAHPFYRWVVSEAGEAAAPKWNFHKYLISPSGELAESFGSRTPPEDATLTAAIEASLP